MGANTALSSVCRGVIASVIALLLSAIALPAVADTVVRGPYLQLATPTSIVVRWRSDQASDSLVRYGDAPDNLTASVMSDAITTEHEVKITGLRPGRRYYYALGSSSKTLSGGDAGHVFATMPQPGRSTHTRVWVIGDSGTANVGAAAVRDAYKSVTGSQATDLWLMLGDNAYPNGTQDEYQEALFETYPDLLRQVPVWPTLGNHDGQSADSATQSGAYYDIFTLPTNAEAGGLASGTEAYYSFDYGQIHFISLESHHSDRSPGGAMMTWLEKDLAANDKNWTIAFWHHSPYSKSGRDSDEDKRMIDMRENALPIIESYGVDLVVSGHGHSYERSPLMGGHYGASSSLTQAMILNALGGRDDGQGVYMKDQSKTFSGTVYAVAGSAGSLHDGPLNHPAMFISRKSLGSMVLEIYGNRLDAIFLDGNGVAADRFTILKGPDTTAPAVLSATTSSATTLGIGFTEPLDPMSAANVGNYAIDRGVQVLQASLSGDGRWVTLETTPLAAGTGYTLVVDGVADRNGHSTRPGSQVPFIALDPVTVSFQDGVAPTAGYAGTRDTFIAESVPDSAFGKERVLRVEAFAKESVSLSKSDVSLSGAQNLATLIAWDLREIPVDAVILDATITLDVSDATRRYFGIYQMKADWQEASATWNDSAGGSPWQMAGARGELDRGTTVLGSVNADSLGRRSVSLNRAGLDLVQSWVDGSVPNHGVIIANSGLKDGLDLASREGADPVERPRLTVTYSLPLPGPGRL
jgi:hypothetical protein